MITTDNDPHKVSEIVYFQVSRDPNPSLRLPMGEDAVGFASDRSADLSKAAQTGEIFSEAAKFSGDRIT